MPANMMQMNPFAMMMSMGGGGAGGGANIMNMTISQLAELDPDEDDFPCFENIFGDVRVGDLVSNFLSNQTNNVTDYILKGR